MLRASVARCTYFGLLWWTFCLCGIDGLIEIVEEQQCYDYEFRLTCRELENHIAVLEAWYTTIEDYHHLSDTTRPPEALKLRTENDSELNRVYIYSSPKHNGVYEPKNHSMFENVINVSTDVKFLNNSLALLNDTVDLMNSVEMGVEFVNMSEGCGAPTFARSYASWHEGDKRRTLADRSLSVNLRSPVSYRCTGVNHCSFILKKDYNPAVRWLPGLVYIKYACFDDLVSLHYCNREVRIADFGSDSEGYIRTPGYPDFYIGEYECRWQLQANPEQRVRVTLVDVSLRSIGPFENHCTDYVTVREPSGAELLSTCNQVELPLQITSTTSTVDIIVVARSRRFFPKRGVLLHYKSIGCVTLPAPSDGYLVYRNADIAHYMCNVNYVFADSRQRARVLWCYDDNRWNDTVPLCIVFADGQDNQQKVKKQDEVEVQKKGEPQQDIKKEDKVEVEKKEEPHEGVPKPGENGKSPLSDEEETKITPETNMIVDVVLPSLLIAALFIGNAFVVFTIYKYRKMKTDDLDEEFNTIPLSGNGNVHSAVDAV